ncbi:sentrin-specific protease 5-like [Thalassophryne amazonica]|uniref:sentrin-specific protease 5-like n=1 Tax=Thalassophryne amazonica TaxID=390379 RepID=UPI001471E5AA|nr:sentrin-specific protease 5-like [Thalassophryne amazonica]
MKRMQSHRTKAKYPKRKQGAVPSIKGVSQTSVHAKRRLNSRLQFWLWRKRRKEQFLFGVFTAKKQGCGFGPSPSAHLKTKFHKCKRKAVKFHLSSLENSKIRKSPLGFDSQRSADRHREVDCVPTTCESDGLSGTHVSNSSLQNLVAKPNVGAGTVTGNMATALPSRGTKMSGQFCDIANSHRLCPTVNPMKDNRTCSVFLDEPNKMGLFKIFDVDSPSGQHTSVRLDQDHRVNGENDERIIKKTESSQSQHHNDVSSNALTNAIHEFLSDFYRIYGSFIPLQRSDVLRHLKRKFNADFSSRVKEVLSEVTKCRSSVSGKPLPSYRVVYKKHMLTLDDLCTLADQNWLNDQVMNMYGELIMESAHHRVHFLNSFFHRQLMTKGYDGVRRWTKQVDLFSKRLVLVPIHLEVHWCLVTADISKKRVCMYDSQGSALLKVARNILKYLMTEAKEKCRSTFENGWTVSFDENIPQQTNENDCGVFVLEYCRCLALDKLLQFSQKHIPKIRKRIYKELCDCKLHE